MRFLYLGITLISLCFCQNLSAQNGSPLEKQNSDYSAYNFNLAYGVFSYQGLIAKVINQNIPFEIKQQGPIHFRFGARINRVIELGTSLNFENQEFTWESSNQKQGYVKIKSFSGLFRSNFHFLKSENFDFYLGLALGLRLDNYDLNIPAGGIDFDIPFGTRQIFPGGELMLGFRGYITDNFGITTEVGLTKSPIQIGLCYRLLPKN